MLIELCRACLSKPGHAAVDYGVNTILGISNLSNGLFIFVTRIFVYCDHGKVTAHEVLCRLSNLVVQGLGG